MKNISSIIKKTYKVVACLVLIIVFFVFYNTYLVDHSLINLRVALNKAAQAQTIEDFENIKPLLKVPMLKEVAKTDTSNRILISMEATENIAATAKKEEQAEDIKFYLKTVIKGLEKDRGGFLSALDRFNTIVYAPEVKLPEEKLMARVKNLLSRIRGIKYNGLLQKAYYELGNLYVQLGRQGEAENAFLSAIQADPGTDLAIKAKFNLAWSCKSVKDYDKAASYFQDIVRESPKNAVSVAGKYQVADVFYKKGEFDRSRKEYAVIAEEDPKSDAPDIALFNAGYISFYNLGDVEGALKYFNELGEKMPQSEITQHELKVTSFNMAADFRREGYRLLEARKYDDAIKAFEDAVKISPYDGRSYSGMGLGLYWTNSKQEALEKVRKSVEISIEDKVAPTNAMFIYVRLNNAKEAVNVGEKALATKSVKREKFRHNLGCAYVLSGRFDEAVAQFLYAIRLNQDFAPAYNGLGWALWMKGEYASAIDRFKEAIAKDPGYMRARFNLGVAYFYMNRFRDAYGEFNIIPETDPNYKKASDYKRHIEENLGYKP